jgi:ATP-dependent 26S proteasome regulatory subunit
MDPALLRPGRLEVQVLVPLPDKDGRTRILGIHSRQLRERLFQFDVVAVSVLDSGTEVVHWPHAFDASGTPW